MRTFLLLIVRKVCHKCQRNIWRLNNFENCLLLSFSPRKQLTFSMNDNNETTDDWKILRIFFCWLVSPWKQLSLYTSLQIMMFLFSVRDQLLHRQPRPSWRDHRSVLDSLQFPGCAAANMESPSWLPLPLLTFFPGKRERSYFGSTVHFLKNNNQWFWPFWSS